MASTTFEYPDLQPGDKVMFATEPGATASQWRLGTVEVCKNNSCDLSIVTPAGTELRTDCWHADDPRCKTQPQSYRQQGRGVFRLAQREIEDRRFRRETVPGLMAAFRRAEEKVEAAQRMLEQVMLDHARPNPLPPPELRKTRKES